LLKKKGALYKANQVRGMVRTGKMYLSKKTQLQKQYQTKISPVEQRF